MPERAEKKYHSVRVLEFWLRYETAAYLSLVTRACKQHVISVASRFSNVEGDDTEKTLSV